MPKVTSPADIARIKTLVASGKTTRAIAAELGIGKSSVARYAKDVPASSDTMSEAEEIPVPVIETMSIRDNDARAFLSDIGIKGPAASLRNEIVPATNPLKNNPRAVQLAETLLGTNTSQANPRAMSLIENLLGEPPATIPSSPRASPAPAPAQELVVRSEPIDRHALITQIQMNVENFAPLLKNVIGNDPDRFKQSLYNMSEIELATLLKVVVRTRTVGNLSNQFRHIFWMTTSAVEMGTQFLGLKSQGLAEALRIQDEEIRLILKEMAMERADSFAQAQRPEMRLGFIVATTLLSVDSMNRIKEYNKKPEKAVDTEKFKDL